MFALPECNFQMTLFFMNYFDKIRTEILKSNGEKKLWDDSLYQLYFYRNLELHGTKKLKMLCYFTKKLYFCMRKSFFIRIGT